MVFSFKPIHLLKTGQQARNGVAYVSRTSQNQDSMTVPTLPEMEPSASEPETTPDQHSLAPPPGNLAITHEICRRHNPPVRLLLPVKSFASCSPSRLLSPRLGAAQLKPVFAQIQTLTMVNVPVYLLTPSKILVIEGRQKETSSRGTQSPFLLHNDIISRDSSSAQERK